MSKRLVIAAFVLLGGAAVALGGWLLLDAGKPVRPSAATKGGAGGLAGDAGTGMPQDGPSRHPAVGGTVLDPQQEAQLRASLAQVDRDASEREVLQSGVAKPWSPEATRDAFRICLGSVAGLVDTNVPGAAEKACACATKQIQRNHPGKPPATDSRNGRRAFDREMKDAVEVCTGRN